MGWIKMQENLDPAQLNPADLRMCSGVNTLQTHFKDLHRLFATKHDIPLL